MTQHGTRSYKAAARVSVELIDEKGRFVGVLARNEHKDLFGLVNYGHEEISLISYDLANYFTPQEFLRRARLTGSFVFHDGTGLMIEPDELERAFRELDLIP
jgi:hypothetical protein